MGRSLIPFPPTLNRRSVSASMIPQQIPMYAADGRPLGFRSIESARRLIGNGFVEAVYGRKGHLKALHSKQPDGASAITPQVRGGTRYSFREHFDSGTVAWKLKRLGKGDDLRPIFMKVVTDCLVRS
jgi:hypothetical protein